MTSLLHPPPRTRPDHDLGQAERRRPLLPTAVLAGVSAAGVPLAVALAVGMTGWFGTDAGSHGAPRSGLRVGAFAWLMGHGSGAVVDGVPVTAVPLGVTLLSALLVWRFAKRAGEAVSGHGPDADRIADGERDWTVPVAVLGFTAGYLAVTATTLRLAALPGSVPDTGRVWSWAVLFAAGLGGLAIAVGSGRLSVWTSGLPAAVPATLAGARDVALAWMATCALVFLTAFVIDLDTAVNVLAQLHTEPVEAALYVLVCLLLVPNAVAFAGAYLLGPGFTVGAGTLVTHGSVTLGALPLFPLLAALPDNGTPPAWTIGMLALPPVAAAVGAATAQRRHPTSRWEQGALRGCAAGLVVAVGFGILAACAGGAVGPGRMADVVPYATETLLHALPAFGLGGLAGGLAMTWWQRRAARRQASAAA